MSRSVFCALPLIAALAACDLANPDNALDAPPEAGGKADLPTGNASVLPTGNGNVSLLSGFHALYDKTHSRCIQAMALDDEHGSPLTVGEVSRDFEITYIRSREDLARELGIDLGLKVKYPDTTADLGFELLDDFTATTRTASFLLKAREEYFVRNRREMELNEIGQGKLATGAKAFVRACGTHYVDGIRYGAQLFVLITYTADDESKVDQIRSTVGVTRAPVASVDGDLNARMSAAASLNNVGVNVRVASRGFALGSDEASSSVLAQLLGSGVTEDTMKVIEEVRADMKASVTRDMCRDLGDGECEGASSPGYFDNVQRFAKPTGVEIGFYDALPNADAAFDSGTGDVFETILAKLTGVDRYVRDFAQLEERMLVAYRNELEPFVTAPSLQKAAYNLAPPADPVSNPYELVDIADHWSGEFLPEFGSQVGNLMKLSTESVEDCWVNASVTVDYECAEEGNRGEDTALWLTIDDKIGNYHEAGRILPLRYQIAAGVRSEVEAEQACSELALGDDPLRLPTAAEAERLAPVLGYGDTGETPDGANPHMLRYRSTAEDCPDPDLPSALFVNDPVFDEPEFVCAAAGIAAKTICVPSTGPMPLEQAP